MSESSAPLFRSPLATAREISDRELRGNATTTELRWLHEHPDIWLICITRTVHDVEGHMAKERRAYAHLKPPPATTPSAEYLDAKKQADKRNVGRIHFLDLAKRRREEVGALLATRGPGATALVGMISSALVALEQERVDDAKAILAAAIRQRS